MTTDHEPDLSNYGTGMGAEYEWLISDHPLALAERLRRAAEFYASETDILEEHEHEDDLSGLRPGMAAEIGGLAEPLEPTADRNQLRHALPDVDSDDVAVAQSRRDYEEYRRAHGEPGYEYPAALLGPGAAAHPPPNA